MQNGHTAIHTRERVSSTVPAAAATAATQKNAKMSRSQPNDSETRKLLCMNGADRAKKTKKNAQNWKSIHQNRSCLRSTLRRRNHIWKEKKKTHTHRSIGARSEPGLNSKRQIYWFQDLEPYTMYYIRLSKWRPCVSGEALFQIHAPSARARMYSAYMLTSSAEAASNSPVPFFAWRTRCAIFPYPCRVCLSAHQTKSTRWIECTLYYI